MKYNIYVDFTLEVRRYLKMDIIYEAKDVKTKIIEDMDILNEHLLVTTRTLAQVEGIGKALMLYEVTISGLANLIDLNFYCQAGD